MTHALFAVMAAAVVSATTPLEEKPYLLGEGLVSSCRDRYMPVVRSIETVILAENGKFRPLLLRLAWHSVANFDRKQKVRGGSNGGCLRPGAPEIDLAENKGLDVATEKLEVVKAEHPFVTYADLYVLAGAVSLEMMGSPPIYFRPGRIDYPLDTAAEKCVTDNDRMPQKRINDDSFPHPETNAYFYRKFGELGFPVLSKLYNDTGIGFGPFHNLDFIRRHDALNMRRMVALMGGHSMGEMHPKISRQAGKWLNVRKPHFFNNDYFEALLKPEWETDVVIVDNHVVDLQYAHRGTNMLPIDFILRQDEDLLEIVKEFAADEELWKRHFTDAWKIITSNGVRRRHGCPKSRKFWKWW